MTIWTAIKTAIALWMMTVVLFVIAVALSHKAKAHETKTGWTYDPSCCSNTHCHPVDDGAIEDKRDGVLVRGFGVVSYSDPRLHWSQDNQDHVCTADGKLLCVYRKPRDM